VTPINEASVGDQTAATALTGPLPLATDDAAEAVGLEQWP
jgi:hypothetical protein